MLFILKVKCFTTKGEPLTALRRKWGIPESRVFEEHINLAEGDIHGDLEEIMG